MVLPSIYSMIILMLMHYILFYPAMILIHRFYNSSKWNNCQFRILKQQEERNSKQNKFRWSKWINWGLLYNKIYKMYLVPMKAILDMDGLLFCRRKSQAMVEPRNAENLSMLTKTSFTLVSYTQLQIAKAIKS